MNEHATARKSVSHHAKVLLSRTDLKALGITVSNSSLLRWELAGRFPRRVRMAGTTVAWLKAEVDDWLEARADERQRHVYAEF
ncbi:helix-turn-helix transcriptional regulator [Rhizobium sp. NRK18]|uniref:helix-turn-helix transcriptional regulator n=1 Tax=Rhizobium sp. NRK18 TaxID=2964667 RepID=UPI0021C27537|nr:AlpA family phage regulatory protein [Rhizobium sp. NRK18]MCQ2002870.1 AlpA family phage regulatory protein [Rhizobium sp. NRK18]